ncbi:hypothetical protein ES703_39666 [subsurface metagenome]
MSSSQKTWNFEELRNLCTNKGLPDSKIYQEALLWKQQRASYHAEQYHKMWRELFSSLGKMGEIKVGGQVWNEAQFASEAHAEAAAQTLHSMADILAQIINKAVLYDGFPEDKVTLYRIVGKLKKQDSAHKIVAAIDKFRNSAEFRYIDAFVNTIKHRRLLDRSYHLEYGENTRNEQAVCFQEFEYKGHRYRFTWATDIIGPYKSRIFELIIEIGNAVNEYLR